MHHSNEKDNMNCWRKAAAQTSRVMTVGGFEFSLQPPTMYDENYIPSDPIIGYTFDLQEGMHGFASGKVKPFRARDQWLGVSPS